MFYVSLFHTKATNRLLTNKLQGYLIARKNESRGILMSAYTI